MGKSFELCFVFLAIFNVTFTLRESYTFEEFEVEFNRQYSAEEREQHRIAFEQNYQQLQQLYQENGGNMSYEVEVNHFMDITEVEKQILLSYRPEDLRQLYDPKPVPNNLRTLALPDSLNYTALGKVTSVKDQKLCGSGWAFSSVSLYESQFLFQNKGEINLSEQYVLECTTSNSNYNLGCTSGWPYIALLNFAEKGLPLDYLYDYTGEIDTHEQDTGCSEVNLVSANIELTQIKHYQELSSEELKLLLSTHGPVSVSISSKDLLYYSSGIFTGCSENTKEEDIDHSVLLVGWTSEDNWIIKNSWGENWGEGGYAVIDGEKNCGIGLVADVIERSAGSESNENGEKVETGGELEVDIEMIDTYGDGWNEYVLGARQNGKIVAVFGERFLAGSSQNLKLSLPTQVETEIMIITEGSNSSQIGFTIFDSSTSTELCEHAPGEEFESNIIFCRFCLNCTNQENTESIPLEMFEVTLRDLGGDGWEGTLLLFKQDATEVEFGGQFIDGAKYGPRTYEFKKNIPVDVIVKNVGKTSQEISFEIRDKYGNIALSRNAGEPLSAEENLGTFCPLCSNLSPIKTKHTSPSPVENKIVDENRAPPQNFKAYIVAISILSPLILILLGVIVYLVCGRQINEKINGREVKFQGVSILGSTATIPDDSGDISKSMEYKLN